MKPLEPQGSGKAVRRDDRQARRPAIASFVRSPGKGSAVGKGILLSFETTPEKGLAARIGCFRKASLSLIGAPDPGGAAPEG